MKIRNASLSTHLFKSCSSSLRLGVRHAPHPECRSQNISIARLALSRSIFIRRCKMSSPTGASTSLISRPIVLGGLACGGLALAWWLWGRKRASDVPGSDKGYKYRLFPAKKAEYAAGEEVPSIIYNFQNSKFKLLVLLTDLVSTGSRETKGKRGEG